MDFAERCSHRPGVIDSVCTVNFEWSCVAKAGCPLNGDGLGGIVPVRDMRRAIVDECCAPRMVIIYQCWRVRFRGLGCWTRALLDE
jgi:hypothetical protein